jgi:hypothetical protein
MESSIKSKVRLGEGLLALLVGALLLVSCSSSSLVVGQKRAAIHPSQVKVYLQPPKRFEQIALVNTDDLGALSFTGQGHLNGQLIAPSDRPRMLAQTGFDTKSRNQFGWLVYCRNGHILRKSDNSVGPCAQSAEDNEEPHCLVIFVHEE